MKSGAAAKATAPQKSPRCIASLPHRRPDVTPAPLGTGAAHLVFERVEVLGAIHRSAVSKRSAFSRAFLAAHSSSKAIVHLAGPLGAPGSGMRFRCHSRFHPPSTSHLSAGPMCSPAGWGHGAEDRVLSSFRAAALSAHLRPQPHSRPAAGTTNNLVWWAVVVVVVAHQLRITSGRLPRRRRSCSGFCNLILASWRWLEPPR